MYKFTSILFAACLFISCSSDNPSKVNSQPTLQNSLSTESLSEDYESDRNGVKVEYGEDIVLVGIIETKNNEKVINKYYVAQHDNKKLNGKTNYYWKDATIIKGEGELFVVKDNTSNGLFFEKKVENDKKHLAKLKSLGSETNISENNIDLQTSHVYGISKNKISDNLSPTPKDIENSLSNNVSLFEKISDSRNKHFNKFHSKALTSQECQAGGSGAESCSYGCGQTDCSTDCGGGTYACCGCNTEQTAGAYCKCMPEDIR